MFSPPRLSSSPPPSSTLLPPSLRGVPPHSSLRGVLPHSSLRGVLPHSPLPPRLLRPPSSRKLESAEWLLFTGTLGEGAGPGLPFLLSPRRLSVSEHLSPACSSPWPRTPAPGGLLAAQRSRAAPDSRLAGRRWENFGRLEGRYKSRPRSDFWPN